MRLEFKTYFLPERDSKQACVAIAHRSGLVLRFILNLEEHCFCGQEPSPQHIKDAPQSHADLLMLGAHDFYSIHILPGEDVFHDWRTIPKGESRMPPAIWEP